MRPRSALPARALTAIVAGLSLALLASPAVSLASARPPDPMNAGEIRLALEKLRVTASVLYVGAHPDDENTAMLAWLANGRKVRTAYLSLTRGDGGQDLLGHELGPALGVIRTQELLAARRVDGAEQIFTRAVDFGFSKNPEETFAFWGRDSILADVVRAIRHFQPDVIVTRFPTDGRGGHGHHTASAILAEQAFTVAADPKRLPGCGPAWQAKRLLWNAFARDGRPDSTWLSVDVGGYEPLLGRSFGEIAALSRSNHKSQGFGIAERHGALPNWLELHEGERAGADLLDGVEMSWRRVPGGGRVDELLGEAEREFDPAHPGALLPRLFEVRAAMDQAASPQAWWAARRALLEDVIRSCTGLWVECVALRASVVPGDTLPLAVSVTGRLASDAPGAQGARGGVDAAVVGDRLAGVAGRLRGRVQAGGTLAETLLVAVPERAAVTQPYWLRLPESKGLYRLVSPSDLDRPENPPALAGELTLTVDGQPVAFPLAAAWRWADPVQGERWAPLEITPPATLALDHEAYVFPDRAARPVTVHVQAQHDRVRGRVSLELPAGWSATPASADVALARTGEEADVGFVVTPAEGPPAASLKASIEIGGRRWSQGMQRVDYPHIPPQTLYPLSSARLVRTDIRHRGTFVAYVAGSGDAIPDALRQLGYDVRELTDEDLDRGDLARFEIVVTGVRAFNTRPRLRALAPRLMEWVKAGGTLVEQYNTANGPALDQLGPWPMKLSNDRVTVEEAPVTFPHPANGLLTTPNAIGASDFDGWVQERGLNFPNPFDPRYETVLSCHDPGEPARDGGLLYARYGQGVFVYCAYAMFRQLPAGVPGAWRLFANLVSAH